MVTTQQIKEIMEQSTSYSERLQHLNQLRRDCAAQRDPYGYSYVMKQIDLLNKKLNSTKV